MTDQLKVCPDKWSPDLMAGHCPLTGRYFGPCIIIIVTIIVVIVILLIFV